MAAKLSLIVLALAFVAVSARSLKSDQTGSDYDDSILSHSKYTEFEIAQISGRVYRCLRDMPTYYWNSVQADLGDTCYKSASYEIIGGGDKESLTPLIVECLRSFPMLVDEDVVATAEKCLTASLAQPL